MDHSFWFSIFGSSLKVELAYSIASKLCAFHSKNNSALEVISKCTKYYDYCAKNLDIEGIYMPDTLIQEELL